ncbi:hypothetical protein LEP1GSC203_1371 [Leptospira terpstrae serovar Hualin str. LT 11-33 = ATCC 700639]|uniref:Uncharacterized protein n=1 Tax=Leptospira terpstrae serovar Hualin str. LT 11-33 = ATCC 700639 TaxID=1257025 RepID=N1VW54_9LEPT|nr:hypothetical protein LEP1GSC203_1371 [Leptospira terpstrae serovar Hualin str. LT 11-33 = ATCC 700639]
MKTNHVIFDPKQNRSVFQTLKTVPSPQREYNYNQEKILVKFYGEELQNEYRS